MFKLKWGDLQFSLVTFAAAMLALYISMRIDLQRPYWGMMTVYIVSQPMAAAVRSKAVYRLLGTLIGAAVAVLLVPLLDNAPLLLCLALALWTGFCLAVSMLDRSPRSYLMMLAGYTAAIIGFGSVNQPADIFLTAVARSEEIIIGIVCATVLHSLWFPKPVGIALRARLGDCLGMADQWASDILANNDSKDLKHDRLRLAAAASEIHILATHLPFDISHFRQTTSVVRALHDRLLLLIPTLSSLSERLAALRSAQPELDLETRQIIAETGAWLKAGMADDSAPVLIQKLFALRAQVRAGDWYGLNQIGLLTSLAELVKALAEAHALLDHLRTPELPVAAPLSQIIAQSGARPLHSDPGLALLAGVTAVTAILVSCFVWISMGWAEGGASAMLASILSCLFAAMDDPTPAMKKFGYSQLLAVPLAGIYLFAIFPTINTFPMLVLSLAPTMLIIGVLIVKPRSALLALITLLNMCNAMALQETSNPDFASFLNLNLSMFFGIFTAIFITRSFRSLSAEANAKRLLRHTWQRMARLAQGLRLEEPASFASHMVDRLAMLTALLAAGNDGGSDPRGLDTLNDLRTGMDLVALQNECGELPPKEKIMIETILRLVGMHYQNRTAARKTHDEQLLTSIDAALNGISAGAQVGQPVLSALVGLRTNLFPDISYPHPKERVAQ